MAFSRKLISEFRVFWEHNRVFSFLCLWSCLCLLAGVLLSLRLGRPFLVLGQASSFWEAWLSWLIPLVAYWLAQVGAAFFVLGSLMSFLLEGCVCFLLGYVGFSTVSEFGWKGVLLQVGIALLSALLFLPLSLHAAAGVRLSGMMRAKLFGSDRGLLYPAEIRLYGLRSLAVLGAVLLFSVCAGAWCFQIGCLL